LLRKQERRERSRYRVSNLWLPDSRYFEVLREDSVLLLKQLVESTEFYRLSQSPESSKYIDITNKYKQYLPPESPKRTE